MYVVITMYTIVYHVFLEINSYRKLIIFYIDIPDIFKLGTLFVAQLILIKEMKQLGMLEVETWAVDHFINKDVYKKEKKLGHKESEISLSHACFN